MAPPAATATETTVAVAEEPPAPKVRLRPKLQPTGAVVDPAPAPTEAAPSAPAPTSDQLPASPAAPSVPPLFRVDPPPAAPTPAEPAQTSAPVAPSAVSTPAAAVTGDPGKFKLKPKVASAPAAGSPPVPPLFLPDDAPVVPPGVALTPPPTAPGAVSRPAGPTSPAPASRSGNTTPPMPIPHVKIASPDLVPEVDLAVKLPPPERGGWKKAIGVIAVLSALGYGAYVGWPHLPAEISVASYTLRTKPGFAISKARTGTAATALPTPSETLNKLAQVPGNAINKAQDALAARRASGQDRVDAAASGEDLSGKTFGVPPAAPIKPVTPPPKAPAATAAVTIEAPGKSAPAPVEATPEAAPEFRAFVVGARISGIFQGNPARAVINGKLSRAGEVVEPGLGITFEGLDAGRKSLVFKDRTGATVTRRF